MLKDKYYYDNKTDAYVKIHKNAKQKWFRILGFAGSSFLFALVMIFGVFYFIGSPKEKKLAQELDFMKLQYELMNKDITELNSVLSDLQERDDNIYRQIFEAEPIDASIRNAGFGGARRYEQLGAYEHSDLVIDTKKKIDKVSKKMYVQSKSFDEVVKLAMKKGEMIASIPAIQPIHNKDLTRMASGYGMRIHPVYKTPKFHKGMDFTAPRGTPIYATGNGVVSEVKRLSRGYGNSVKISHGYGYHSFYAHMQSFKVRKGQKVKRGDIIGFVGNTGLSTAPHLHYEIFKNGDRVNPINYYFNDLSPEEYDLMLKLSKQENQSFD
jgi:murein DD-endopeptidase MepM/ murein hydrolase activator NlpD